MDAIDVDEDERRDHEHEFDRERGPRHDAEQGHRGERAAPTEHLACQGPQRHPERAGHRDAGEHRRDGPTGASRFDEIALIAACVLFSKLLVTVSIPAEAISIGTRLG